MEKGNQTEISLIEPKRITEVIFDDTITCENEAREVSLPQISELSTKLDQNLKISHKWQCCVYGIIFIIMCLLIIAAFYFIYLK